jgi:hypothetical protein
VSNGGREQANLTGDRMRAVIFPTTAAMRRDLVERLIASELEVVGLIRLHERCAEGQKLLDLSVYGQGMLSWRELEARMAGCEIVYQDIYSFANLRHLTTDDDLARVAWHESDVARLIEPGPASFREDIYEADDAIIRLHLWQGDGQTRPGRRVELVRRLIEDAALRHHLERRTVATTLILPRRVARLQDGTDLAMAEALRSVLVELLDYWAGLRTDQHPAWGAVERPSV